MRDVWMVLIGVIAGELSHFGRVIHDQDWPTVREMIGFTLQMGFIVLLAGLMVEWLDLKSDLAKAVVAALLALSAREIMPWAKSRALKILENIVFK